MAHYLNGLRLHSEHQIVLENPFSQQSYLSAFLWLDADAEQAETHLFRKGVA